MAWIYLLLAGFLEVGWAVGLTSQKDAGRVFFLTLLIVSLIGLKLTTPANEDEPSQEVTQSERHA